MSEDDFWRLTPREYESLLTRRRHEGDNDDYRTAAIICATYNVWRSPGSPPLTPEEIIGKKKESAQSPEDMLEIVRTLQKSFGGEVPVE